MDPQPEPDQPDPGQRRGIVGGRNLPVAIAVGVVLAVVFLGTLFWRAEAFVLVLTVLAGIAAIEVTWVLGRAGARVLLGPLLIGVVATVWGAFLLGGAGQAFGITVLFLSSLLWLLADRQRTAVVDTLAATMLVGVWLALLASYAGRLVVREDGALVVLAAIGAVILTDIGGYAFGVPFGKHKIVPSISPGKSWEGLIGGLIVATVLAAAVLPVLGDTFTPVSAAVVALGTGLAGFLGDIAESMIKRDLGVKDLGGVLPGHGGVLDRVDGILVALPVAHYGLWLFG
ncbi:MAG: phosphatidate cytidylyltransferase [Nitriliruptoraceae bacterium]